MRRAKLRAAALDKTAHLYAVSGSANRRYLDQVLPCLPPAIATSSKALPCAVSIDVARFKCVNDCLGQAVGDRVLQAMSDIFHADTREKDSGARPGGMQPGRALTVSWGLCTAPSGAFPGALFRHAATVFWRAKSGGHKRLVAGSARAVCRLVRLNHGRRQTQRATPPPALLRVRPVSVRFH